MESTDRKIPNGLETHRLETHRLETHRLETHRLETHRLETHRPESRPHHNDGQEKGTGETGAISRARVLALDNILGIPHQALDHGFVRVIDYMGDESAIVQAARVSYGKGTKSLRSDTSLIRYLMRHRHTTPFEMCEIKFHVKLPIFIARQWIRHRTASVNEYSARYSILDKEFYIPDKTRLTTQSTENNQGAGQILEEDEAQMALDLFNQEKEQSHARYEFLLNQRQSGEIIDPERQGLTRELARMTLPLNAYTQWYWKVNLHNLLHFLSLRADPHAQQEIRVYAEIISDMVKIWVPIVYDAFVDYRQHAFHLSKPMKDLVTDRLKGINREPESYGLSKREWKELSAALDLRH